MVRMFIYTFMASDAFGSFRMGGGVVFHKSVDGVRDDITPRLEAEFPKDKYTLKIVIGEPGATKDEVIEYFDRNENLLIDFH